MSASMFTIAPGISSPSVVFASVVGIRAISNPGSFAAFAARSVVRAARAIAPTDAIVSETPSIATPPFGAMYRSSSRSAGLIRIRQSSPR